MIDLNMKEFPKIIDLEKYQGLILQRARDKLPLFHPEIEVGRGELTLRLNPDQIIEFRRLASGVGLSLHEYVCGYIEFRKIASANNHIPLRNSVVFSRQL